MAYDIIIGRDDLDKKKFGDKATILIGKHYVTMGETTSLSNKVLLDVARPHVILVTGKRGSGKSTSLSVIAEELANLDEDIKKNLAFLFFDTMGIFWTMKYPNERDSDLLKQWNLESKGFNVNLFTPIGLYNEYKKKELPVDYSFSIKTNELNSDDWCKVFEVNLIDPLGILIERVLDNLKDKNYSIEEILKEIKKDKKSDKKTKDSAENRFRAASKWGLFDEKGSEIKDLVKAGEISILDISAYTNWSVKGLAIALISRKLLRERIGIRKKEELSKIKESSIFDEEKKELPLVWIMVDECLPYNTEIITSKAHTPIGEIIERKGEGEDFEVLTFDLDTKKYINKKVKNVFRKGKRELVKIRTECGKELVCTPEHRVLTRHGFWSAISVSEIGSIAIQHYSEDPRVVKARLLGHLFGDGWASEKTKSLGFSGKKSDRDLEKIKYDLRILGFSSSNIYTRKTKSNITDHNNTNHTIVGISKSIGASTKSFRYFKNIGAIMGDKTIRESHIPQWLFNSSAKEKAEFLAAYLGSDGLRISQSSTAKSDFNSVKLSFHKLEVLEKNAFKFANQLKDLFESLGIRISRIAKRKGNIRKDGNKTIKIVLTIAKSMDNMTNFLEKIGYRYCGEKEIEGYKWLAYLKAKKEKTKERIEINKRIQELYKKGIKKIEIARMLNIPKYYVGEWTRHNRKIRASNSFPHFDEWISARYSNGVIFECIKNMELLKEQEVYDLEIDELHNFVANGFIVHNCHEFMPKDKETIASNDLIMLLREGRQPGISLVLATQQPGEIAKDVITQADIVISHRLTAKVDIEALNSVMQTYLIQDIQKYLNQLPDLKGAAIVLDDNSERIYPIQIRPKLSWHGGESPSAIKIKKKLLDLKL